jgi:MFS family permease
MEMIKSALGWHVATCFVTTTAGGMYVLGVYKTFGVQALGGSSETFLSTVGALSALFNAGGRVCWGALGDRIGPIEALMLMSSIFSLILLTYPLAPALGGQNAFALWTFLIFGCEGGNFALYMPVVIQLFGIVNSSANYAVVSTIYAAASVLNIAYLSTQKVGFEVAIRSMGCLTLVGFVNCCLLRLHVSKKARLAAMRCE